MIAYKITGTSRLEGRVQTQSRATAVQRTPQGAVQAQSPASPGTSRLEGGVQTRSRAAAVQRNPQGAVQAQSPASPGTSRLEGGVQTRSRASAEQRTPQGAIQARSSSRRGLFVLSEPSEWRGLPSLKTEDSGSSERTVSYEFVSATGEEQHNPEVRFPSSPCT